MTELEELFYLQSENDKNNFDMERLKNDAIYREAFIKERMLLIYDQAGKLLDTFNWKTHVLEKIYDNYNTREQIIDTIKYLISLYQLSGKDFSDFYKEYVQRSYIVSLRSKWMKIKYDKKDNVVIFDIDGVILNYDKAYTEYLLSKGYVQTDLDRKSYSYHSSFNITKLEDEKLQHSFITEGNYLKLEVYPEVVEIIKDIKKEIPDVYIIMVTARPAWSYKRLINDTVLLLDQYSIPYDSVIFDKNKSDAILEKILPANVICFIEDRDKHAIEVSHLDIPVLMIDKTYNQSIGDMSKSGIHRISEENLKAILTFIKINKEYNA